MKHQSTRAARHAAKGPRGRSGFALVTGLILLVVMTILGLTSMRSATLGTRMAVNQQHKQQSFQAAENALTEMLGAPPGDIAPDAETPGTTRAHSDYFTSSGVSGQPDVSADLSVQYLGTETNLLVSGFHLNATGYVYQADSEGRVDGTGAQTTNRMGIVLIR